MRSRTRHSPAMPSAPLPHFQDLLTQATTRLLGNEALEPFCQWFDRALAELEDAQPGGDAELRRRRRRLLARMLWSAVPVPANRWRPRPLPKVDRNAPCHCGSGRKHKHCCGPLDPGPLPLPPEGLLELALSVAEPAMLNPASLREVPPQALGLAAAAWNRDGRPGTTVQVLGPLFQSAARLDGRHETAFDMLVDALLTLGREQERHELVARIAQAPNRELATAARCRQVSMVADAGREEEAWALFTQARRADPDNPQLWHLELTLLLAQGRREEARLRAPLLAAQARRHGFDDMAGMLEALGREGFGALTDHSGLDQDDDDLLEAWARLAALTPAETDAQALQSLYRVVAEPDAGGGGPLVRLEPSSRLDDLEEAWVARDGDEDDDVEDEFEDDLEDEDVEDGDDDFDDDDFDDDDFDDDDFDDDDFDGPPDLANDVQRMHDCLAGQPALWLSLTVLQDLLRVGQEVAVEHGLAGLGATRRVASHAARVLRALLPPGQAPLDEDDGHARDALRVLDLAIQAAALARDPDEFEHLVRWGLELAPQDTFGWQQRWLEFLLEHGRYEEALTALGDDGDDPLPPLGHLRVLALYGAGRAEEAARQLREVHADFPLYARMLLPEVLDPPRGDDLPYQILGGEQSAWEHRSQMRPTWVRSGALRWLAGQDLDAIETEGATFGPAEQERLARLFHFPTLHGLLTAVATAPAEVRRPLWGLAVRELYRGQEEDRPPLRALGRLHRHLRERAAAAGSDPQPLLDEIAAVTGAQPDDLQGWTEGFLSGAELAKSGWYKAGFPLRARRGPFAALRRLTLQPRAVRADEPARQEPGPAPAHPQAAWQATCAALRRLWQASARAGRR
jgi:tetratricopeptide (TPR) repeat protein